jgi:predicted MFS family arabinose efflux permease
VPSADRASASDRLILGALWLMVFSVSSQFLIIAPTLPRIAEQLGVSPARLSPLVTGYALAVGGVALLMGPVSDRFGRRRMLLMGTAALSASLALHGLARDYPALLAVRVLAGASGGILTGAAAAFVGDHFPYERRGWANGWVLSGLAAGQILGVPLGAVLADRMGFRAPFLVFALSTALAFGLIWRFLPRPRTPRAGSALSIRGALRHYAALVSRREVAAAAGAYFATYLATALYVVYLPEWLERALGATPGQAAAVFAFGGAAILLAGPRAGRLSDRVGRRPVVVGASLGTAALMLGTPWLVVDVRVAYAVFFALMTLVAARAGPLDALLSEIVGEGQRGSLMSLMMAVGQLGFGLGAMAAGATYSSLGYAGNSTGAAAAALLLAGLVWRFLPEPALRPAAAAG